VSERDTDADLVERTRRGDKEAFSALVLKYQERVVNVVYQRTGDRERALDVAQEVFVKAYRAIGSFKGNAAFYTWLYRIALNTTVSLRRSLGRERVSFSLDQPLDAEGERRHDPADAGCGPAEEASRHEEVAAVRRAIAELDEEHNQVVVLKDLEQLSYEEIAEILECPVGSVKSRLHRARQRLREKLERVLRT
jgi:RNA polymerase sigma-70 factor (ECF subfamily)